jgi:RNA polymerase sigma factor (TIGR02999 family)
MVTGPQGSSSDPTDEVDALASALAALRSGEPGALERLVPLIYEDLRTLARQRIRGERNDHTLGTTAVVHEAYLRLLQERRLTAADRGEFLAAASNTMRRLLVDYARARNRKKRGGGVEAIPLERVAPFLSDRASQEMLHLDQALERLAARMPRAARVFELKTFGGLQLLEIADLEGTSAKTIQRDYAAARAWLRKEVRGDGTTHGEPAP